MREAISSSHTTEKDLCGSIIEKTLRSPGKDVGVRQIMVQARQGRVPAQELTLPYEDMVNMGKDLVESGQLVNHLRPIS